MSWELDSGQPIFKQIVDRIRMDIVSGKYQPGERAPSVRELAAEAAVNPNTMQRAFAELERMGLVYSKRTSGRFITEDKQLIEQMRAQIAEEKVALFLEGMQNLGFGREEMLSFMERYFERNSDQRE